MEKEVMIEIHGLSKIYRLGEIGTKTFQHALQSWWAEKRGKADPNRAVDHAPENTEFYALKDIDLTIYKGETVGLIGLNGAGKSTLLKILARVTAPSKGRLDLYGRTTSMLEVGTGFNGELTGRENIYMNGAILGMTRAEIDAKLDQIIAFSELETFIDTPVKRYSSGMYTKLGFSVASHLDSEIMIMDEVLAVGDIAFQNKCISRMRETAKEEGKTVLYVSHNMNQIRSLCDRCIVLDHGRIIFDGDTAEAIEHYLDQFSVENSRMDYRQEPRPDWLTDTRMRIQRAEYIGHDTGMFKGNEPLRIGMDLEGYGEIRDLGLRIEISSAAEQRLGTYFLYDICDVHAGDHIHLEITADISDFTDASYHTVYCFFVRDNASTNLNIDRVQGLSFTHTSSVPASKIRWETNNWGYLSLNGAEVTRLEKK